LALRSLGKVSMQTRAGRSALFVGATVMVDAR